MSAVAVSVSVYEKPTEALPWRVVARKGALVNTYRRNTEQEARDPRRAH